MKATEQGSKPSTVTDGPSPNVYLRTSVWDRVYTHGRGAVSFTPLLFEHSII